MSIESHALPTPPSEPSSCRCQSSIADDSPRILAIGELDIAGVPLLDAEITALRAAGFRHLILDLRARVHRLAGGCGAALTATPKPGGTASRSH
jgi:hypothetical protein